ncbi:MAG TPA: hypothetical protein ENJ32_04045 [Crenotrichaceae bacterium]|nr:hypothetical protein [Crenotrichaceae bacterium]
MSKQHFQIVLIALSISLLTGCGLRLKGSGALPTATKRIYVTGIPAYNLFTRQLQTTLELSGGQLTRKPEASDLHLHVIDQRRTRRELSLSQRGKANEYELTFKINFEVVNNDGQQIMPSQTISISRDYFNQQLRVLGKANEEETIWQDIYKTAVNNFLQRLDIALKQPVTDAENEKQ